ncbi:MAG: CocE/NonD family hydrolase [Anaerolineales bacterium]|nr:CocE/NonD family hydrolase [Anaerolineales bacterium]
MQPARDAFIPVRDGARLSARLWLPDGPGPWPALLEYIPYRKNDFTALRDSLRHPWFAAHGYVCVRVDMRGSGDSDGLLLDEYLALEQDDACDVIAWIAAQPWCTGAVGMFGKSWGGFNALQVAARRPPALRAIITIYSTDDRYADDVHYRGGAVLASEALNWATTMLAYNARPPDPLRRPDDWRALWQARLDHTPPFAETWFAHQRRDGYWRHGSVCEDFDAIDIPVFAVGGWADGYTNPVLRMLAGLKGPRLGLIGPWVHEFPEVADPLLVVSPWAPAASTANPQDARPGRIGFLQESLRWWDHWLKGLDTGILREPRLRAFLQDSAPPAPVYDVRAGRWAAHAEWPPALEVEPEVMAVSGPAEIPASLAHGQAAGMWCAYGQPDDPPGEQSAEDELCLTRDLAPGDRVREYLGLPVLAATLICDRPQAHLVARLCDVGPDGTSTLVSNGILNLSQRESAALPTAVPVGRPFTVSLQLDAIGHRLLPGHRWRLALSQTWWPRVWPVSQPASLRLLTARLELPLQREDAGAQVVFDTAETTPRMAHTVLRVGERSRRSTNEADGTLVLVDQQDDGWTRLDAPGGFDDQGLGLAGLEFDAVSHDTYRTPVSASGSPTIECRRQLQMGRGDWRLAIEAIGRLALASERDAFVLENRLTVMEEGRLLFERSWRRDLKIDVPPE